MFRRDASDQLNDLFCVVQLCKDIVIAEGSEQWVTPRVHRNVMSGIITHLGLLGPVSHIGTDIEEVNFLVIPGKKVV